MGNVRDPSTERGSNLAGITSFDVEEWHAFLQEWNRDFLSEVKQSRVDLKRLTEVYSELRLPLERGWLGEAPATTDLISLTESRLGVLFPSDYRAFLTVSNGWVGPGFGSIYMVSPVQLVDLYAKRHPDLIQIFLDESQFFYRSGKVEESKDPEFLRGTIALCDQSTGKVLLFDPDSAAQAFWIADFHDRARVFASFTDLILFERTVCQESFSQVLASFGASSDSSKC